MLHEVHISDLGVIDDLDLELDPGLTVLTGETGTGKTMVTSGLALALGAKASAQVVRAGADAARVQARFDAAPDLEEWAEDGDLVLARTVRVDGKGGARIGGQIATVRALGELGARLAEVHGQHQSLRLLEPSTQTAFLDRFPGGEHLVALARCREEAGRVRSVQIALEALRRDARDRARELDLLAYQVREIEVADPAPARRRRSRPRRPGSATSNASASSSAMPNGRSPARLGPRTCSPGCRLRWEPSRSRPEAAELAARARGLAAEAAELARDVGRYGEGLALDPERLQIVRERIASLRGLQRKYGADDDAVRAYLVEARDRLEQLEGADEHVAELDAQLDEARQALQVAASEVSVGRRAAAPELEAALRRELDALGMPRAALEVALVAVPEIGPGGAETVELRFSGGDGQPGLPLARSASGGELSRVMLACRSVLADLDEVPTLVFDEVDAGIGGEAGLAVGPAWRGWLRPARCSSSHTCRRSRVSPTATSACASGRARRRAGPGRGKADRRALTDARRYGNLAALALTRRNCSRGDAGSERGPVAPA